jgi:hypothetical protein
MGGFPKNCPRVRSRGGFRNSSLRNSSGIFLLPLSGKVVLAYDRETLLESPPPTPSFTRSSPGDRSQSLGFAEVLWTLVFK